MGNSVLIKLQAQDDLTPELERIKENLASARNKVKEFAAALNELKSNKKSILAGDNVDTGIVGITKLQNELRNLKATNAEANAVKQKQRELERALNSEIQKLNLSLREQSERYRIQQAVASRKIKDLKREESAIDDVNKKIKDNNAVRNSNINSLVRHIRQVETLVLSFYGLKRVYDVLLGSGINLHRQIESQTAGISALITANTRLSDGSGDLAKHFAIASSIAERTMKKIKTASVETAATFPELTAIFQQAVGGALGAGKAMGDAIDKQIDNTINLAKRMSNIASAIGMPMQQVNEEIRSVIEGTIDINSRIAKMIGITNEEIRKAKTEKDGLVKYLDQKLKAFDSLASLQSFDRMVARIKDKIDNIKLDGTDHAFKNLKGRLVELDLFLKANNAELVRLTSMISTFVTGAAIDGVRAFIQTVKDLKVELEIATSVMAVWFVGGRIAASFATAGKAVLEVVAAVKALRAATDAATAATAAYKAVSSGLRGLGIVAIFSAAAYAVYKFTKNLDDAKVNTEKLRDAIETLRDGEKLKGLNSLEIRSYMDEIGKKIAEAEQKIKDLKNKENDFNPFTNMTHRDKFDIFNYEKEIASLKKNLQQYADQLGVTTKREEEFKNSVDNQIAQLQAAGQVSEDFAKIMKEDFSEKAQEASKAVATLEEKIAKLALTISERDLKGKVLDDAQKQIAAANDALNRLKDKEAADKAERQRNEAKRAHDEHIRNLRDKFTAQADYYKSVGDVANQNAQELKSYEMELQEKVRGGLLKTHELRQMLHNKEKELAEERKKSELEDRLDIYERMGKLEEAWSIKKQIITQELTKKGATSEEIENITKKEKEEYIKKESKTEVKHDLDLITRKFELQKRALELYTDETFKKQELITIEYKYARDQYDMLLKNGEITREHYEEAMALEGKLHQKQMFDASTWGQIMHSGLNSLENAMGNFFDYSSDRFMKFGDLAQDILGQIYKQIVKMTIIQPLLNSVTGMLPGMFGGSAPTLSSKFASAGAGMSGGGAAGISPFAQGGVFSSPDLHSYANSIVSKPTFFKFAKGGIPDIGVMGEKNGGSPEAIMPLTRTSNGDLGVKAQVGASLNNVKVEVINQTREDVKVSNAAVRRNDGEWVISLVLNGVSKNVLGSRETLRGLLA